MTPLTIFTQSLVHRVGGVERAALAAGVSKSSISIYQRPDHPRQAPLSVLTALDRHSQELPVGSLDRAISAAHKEGAESLQAAMDKTCISCLEREIVEDISAKLELLRVVRNAGRVG